MSTQPLYHGVGIRGYQDVRTESSGGETVFTIRQGPGTCRCEACGSRDLRLKGQVERRLRSPPIGGRATAVVLPIPRVARPVCGTVRRVKVDFDDPRRTWSGGQRPRGVRMLRRMAGTLKAHRAGLVAYYAYPIRTGPLEGTNTKIKTRKRPAYGPRDRGFFELKVVAIYEATDAFLG